MPTLLEVHAHPDDESITSGGLFAWCADRGIETVLVTCTGGELGEIVDPSMDQVAIQPQLAKVREEELRAACAALGIKHLHLLGYRDSGMAGAPENTHPDAFARADLDVVAARLAGLLRKHRPDVVITYNENGGYGHPDHVQAHRITMRALELAPDPTFRGDLGPPSEAKKIYHTAVPFSRLLRFADALQARGVTNEFAQRLQGLAEAVRKQRMAPPSEQARPEELPFGVPDHMITTTIDARAYVERKFQAMAAHRTQLNPAAWGLNAPEDLRRELWGVEYFIRVRSLVDAPLPETDVFAGIVT